MKAIFFDLDGVLINSEIMHQEMTREFLEQEHYDVPPGGRAHYRKYDDGRGNQFGGF